MYYSCQDSEIIFLNIFYIEIYTIYNLIFIIFHMLIYF